MLSVASAMLLAASQAASGMLPVETPVDIPQPLEEQEKPRSANWRFHDLQTLAFMKMDLDHDDIVTDRELWNFYTRRYSMADMKPGARQAAVRSSMVRYIRAYDIDGSGDVSFGEVVDGGVMGAARSERASGPLT